MHCVAQVMGKDCARGRIWPSSVATGVKDALSDDAV